MVAASSGLLAAAALGSLLALPTARPGAGRDTEDDLETFLATLVERARAARHIGAAAFVVVRDGGVLCQRGFGSEDPQERVPVDPEASLFWAGSIGKVFVATAAQQLVEAGELELDAPVTRFLERVDFGRAGSRDVTVGQLLTHTSGIQERMLGSLLPPESAPPSLAGYFALHPPCFVRPAGQAIRYSNIGLALAGLVIERVTGQSFDRYVEQHLFAPLGMTRSSFRQPLPPDLAARLVGQRSRSAPLLAPYPAGSLATTPADMGRFLLAQLGAEVPVGAEILSAASLRSLHERRFSAQAEMPGIALGFFESFVNGRRALFHTGDRGHHSVLWMLPEEHCGFYLVYVAEDGASASFREQFTQAFIDRLFPAATPFVLPAPPAGFAARAARFTGTYRFEAGAPLTIEKLGVLPQEIDVSDRGDGELRARLGLGGPSLRIVEVAPGLFRSEDAAYLSFRADGEGRIERLDVSGGISDPGGAERLAWYERASLHLSVLLATYVLFLLRVAGLALGALWRRVRRLPRSSSSTGPASRAWRLFGWASACAATSPLLVLAWILSKPFPLTSPPWILPVLASVILISALLALAMSVQTALAWLRQDGTLARRCVLGLASCLSLCSLPVLAYWNLLGFRF